MRKILRYAAAVAAAGMILSACQTAEPQRAEGESQGAGEVQSSENLPGEGGEEAQSTEDLPGEGGEEAPNSEAQQPNPYKLSEAERPKVQVLEDLGLGTELLTETFYQAGDINKSFRIYIDVGSGGDALASENITMLFSALEPGAETTGGISGSADFSLEAGENVYGITLEIRDYREGEILQESSQEMKISFREEESAGVPEILLEGGGVFDGTYYPWTAYEGMDLTARYAAPVELGYLPTEDLGLLRNTIYALHGRKFRDPVLKEYFEKKFWYKASAEPEDFSESVLNDVERANIRLIQELEQTPYDSRTQTGYQGTDGLGFAPYLEFLDVNPETGISVDLSGAEDLGTFWKGVGTISLPVTMTRSQWEEAMAGGRIEVVVDERTGAVKFLEYHENEGYFLYEEGEKPEEYLNHGVGVRYNYETGLYEFWQDSDDTIMKPVYEGEIWVAKGAVFGSDVFVTAASKVQTAMEVPKENSEGSGFYSGGWLIHDGKGCVLALYALGD